MDWDNKTNEEIKLALSEMGGNHEALRLKLLAGLDALVALEHGVVSGFAELKKRGVTGI